MSSLPEWVKRIWFVWTCCWWCASGDRVRREMGMSVSSCCRCQSSQQDMFISIQVRAWLPIPCYQSYLPHPTQPHSPRPERSFKTYLPTHDNLLPVSPPTKPIPLPSQLNLPHTSPPTPNIPKPQHPIPTDTRQLRLPIRPPSHPLRPLQTTRLWWVPTSPLRSRTRRCG